MKPQPSTDLKKAFGHLGFPQSLLVTSVPADVVKKAFARVADMGFDAHIFRTREALDDSLCPSIFGRFAEWLFNEGVVLRQMRQELDSGYHILAVHVPERHDADKLASALYALGGRRARYFGDYTVEYLNPASISLALPG